MLKSDLVNILMTQRRLTLREAEHAVEHIFEVMKAELAKGRSIELRGFGIFHVRNYKAYRGHNPKTSESIDVGAKRGVLFRTGKELRERVNTALQSSDSSAEQPEPESEKPEESAA